MESYIVEFATVGEFDELNYERTVANGNEELKSTLDELTNNADITEITVDGVPADVFLSTHDLEEKPEEDAKEESKEEPEVAEEGTKEVHPDECECPECKKAKGEVVTEGEDEDAEDEPEVNEEGLTPEQVEFKNSIIEDLLAKITPLVDEDTHEAILAAINDEDDKDEDDIEESSKCDKKLGKKSLPKEVVKESIKKLGKKSLPKEVVKESTEQSVANILRTTVESLNKVLEGIKD